MASQGQYRGRRCSVQPLALLHSMWGAAVGHTLISPLLWVVMVWVRVMLDAVGAAEKGQEPMHTNTVTSADHQRQSRVSVNHHIAMIGVILLNRGHDEQ